VRVEERIELDAAGLADLAAATYRLSRLRERRRLEAMGTAEVVSRHEVLRFERAPGA
jgi:hypothetical protein